MQEERLDGSYLITKEATEDEISAALINELNRSVTVANSAYDLPAIRELNNAQLEWLGADNKFYLKKVKGKWKKFKK